MPEPVERDAWRPSSFPGTDLTPPCCHSVTITAWHDSACPNYQPRTRPAPAWVWYEDFGDDPSDYLDYDED